MGSVRTGMGTVFAAGLLFLVGCGGNALDGSWSTTISSQGTTIKETWDLNADMSASVNFKITQIPNATCTGSLDYTGYDWSSTDTTITLSGSSSCKTSLVCSAGGQHVSVPCSAMTDVAGLCHYKLSTDENSLVISSCSKGMTDATFTRDEM